ncbi:MAG: extracellular solute-binding protein [Microbacterium sp.]|nr:extracellular solute-binding protein [Microbacterium sp.]
MNTRSTMRAAAGLAAVGIAIGSLAACSGGGGEGEGGDGDVTLTWWHNATSGPLPAVWEEVAAEFEEAHPGVTVEQTGYQNEELQRTLIPNALAAGDPPDLFQVWPGGELRGQVDNEYLMPLDEAIPDTIESVGPTVKGWQVDDQTYGIPFTFGIEGFWYNTDEFEAAGAEIPTTFDELVDTVGTLRDAGTVPIAVGAGSGWPAAHWWYQFALKSCSAEALAAAQEDFDFGDPCWVEAGEGLQEFIGAEPFQDGFLGTVAQEGAGSSAGLLANGQAAMELMGHWNAGVIGGLTADQQVPPFLGWFPVPAIAGADGDPTAALGGGDGFGCAKDAPPECAELLEYIMSEDVQARFAASGAGIPTFGTTVGNAMNEGIVNLFAGTGTPEDIVTKMEDAAATL